MFSATPEHHALHAPKDMPARVSSRAPAVGAHDDPSRAGQGDFSGDAGANDSADERPDLRPAVTHHRLRADEREVRAELCGSLDCCPFQFPVG